MVQSATQKASHTAERAKVRPTRTLGEHRLDATKREIETWIAIGQMTDSGASMGDWMAVAANFKSLAC